MILVVFSTEMLLWLYEFLTFQKISFGLCPWELMQTLSQKTDIGLDGKLKGNVLEIT